MRLRPLEPEHLGLLVSSQCNFSDVPTATLASSQQQKVVSYACSRATHISASLYSPTGSTFSRNVPSNRSGVWGTIAIAERTAHHGKPISFIEKMPSQSVNPISVVSMPSILMVPAAGSIIRNNASKICTRIVRHEQCARNTLPKIFLHQSFHKYQSFRAVSETISRQHSRSFKPLG